MNKMRILPIVALLAALATGGCAVVSKATAPVLGLATEDAQATIAWIDEQVAAGTLTAQDAELAKACPEAVLALSALREGIAEAETPDGFKGLIYFGTIKKYGGSERDEVVRAVTQTAASCIPLVPYTKLRNLF